MKPDNLMTGIPDFFVERTAMSRRKIEICICIKIELGLTACKNVVWKQHNNVFIDAVVQHNKFNFRVNITVTIDFLPVFLRH
jgi:hypothetical protein